MCGQPFPNFLRIVGSDNYRYAVIQAQLAGLLFLEVGAALLVFVAEGFEDVGVGLEPRFWSNNTGADRHPGSYRRV
jgi:hypothetical protein